MTKKNCDKNHNLIEEIFLKKGLLFNNATANTAKGFPVDAKIRCDEVLGKAL
jgi:hypothetical protein